MDADTRTAAPTPTLAEVRVASRADAETLLGMGMVEGLAQTWDRLDAFVTRS